jgi:hypothetical protein
LVGIAVLACVLATTLVAALRPRNFPTYQDAIGYVLERRDIRYQRITVERQWPDTVNTIFYTANVSVLLGDGRSAGGRLECATADGHRCKVVLRELNIAGELLPELSEGISWRWPAWVQKLLTR